MKVRKPWFVYLLECEDGSIYTGIAVDVAARYEAHQKGTGARYTRAHQPKKLLAVVEFSSRSAASQAEYAVKQMTAGEKREFARRAVPEGGGGKKENVNRRVQRPQRGCMPSAGGGKQESSLRSLRASVQIP